VRLTGYTEDDLERTSLDFCLRILRAGAAYERAQATLIKRKG
jgi:hypothetical protein